MMTRARQPSAPSTEDPPTGDPPVQPPGEPRPGRAADQTTPAPSDPRPPEPPAGSRKARLAKVILAKVRRDHPVLYASRHVGAAVLEVLAGLLGLGVLLRSLLPRIDWSWIPLPDIDLSWLPDITKPEWLRYLDVVYWIRRFVDLPDINLPTVSIPAWLPALAGNLKFVVPVVIAVIVATAEVQRRKRKQPADGEDATGNDSTGQDGSAGKTAGEGATGAATISGSAPDGQTPTGREKAEDHADR